MHTPINLIKNAFDENAFDAMPNGGKLTIGSRREKSNFVFTFEDTGTGMTQETLDKLWTPLFTTKAKGMGFGLPISKRIVEAHRGKISVESTVGRGTKFTVTIPLNVKSVSRSNEVSAQAIAFEDLMQVQSHSV